MQNTHKLKAWFWIWRVFGTNSHLNETACFGKNGAVLSTVHQKKKPETVPFWRHCGSSSSPRRARQGKKKIFLPPVFTDFLPLKSIKKTLTKDTHLPKSFPRVGRAVEGRQHNGAPAVSLPCFSINTGEMKKQDPGKKRGDQEKRENRTREEQRGEGREKKRREEKRKEEKKRKKKAEEGEEGKGEAPPPLPPSAPQ